MPDPLLPNHYAGLNPLVEPPAQQYTAAVQQQVSADISQAETATRLERVPSVVQS